MIYRLFCRSAATFAGAVRTTTITEFLFVRGADDRTFNQFDKSDESEYNLPMMKQVYQAPDEFMALSVKSLLDQEGITSEIRRYENVWLDGLPKLMHGAWGEVLVTEDDFDDAKFLVDAFLSTNLDKQQ